MGTGIFHFGKGTLSSSWLKISRFVRTSVLPVYGVGFLLLLGIFLVLSLILHGETRDECVVALTSLATGWLALGLLAFALDSMIGFIVRFRRRSFAENIVAIFVIAVFAVPAYLCVMAWVLAVSE